MGRGLSFRQKIKLLGSTMLVVFLLYLYAFLSRSGVLGGEESNMVKAMAKRNKTTVGTVLDKAGEIISYGPGAGKSSVSNYPEIYGYLVGYSDRQYGNYGIYDSFQNYLIETLDSKETGATVQLTTDTLLQSAAYDLLKDKGSMVILENKSGRILALASRGEIPLNTNELGEKYEEYSSYEGFWLPNGTVGDKDAPGSVFKVITAACSLENGCSDWTYTDRGEFTTPLGYTVHNYGRAAYGNVDLQKALQKSVNTYFANLGVKLGAEKLKNTAEKFGFNHKIQLDFCTLTPRFEMPAEVNELAMTSFGQGKTTTNPLHMAMWGQAIADGGRMMKPYVVECAVQGEKKLYEGNQEILDTVLSEKNAAALKSLLHQTAVGYGFDEDTYGWVGGKSGTCELGNGKNHCYLLLFTETYSLVISANETSGTSGELMPAGKEMVKLLSEY